MEQAQAGAAKNIFAAAKRPLWGMEFWFKLQFEGELKMYAFEKLGGGGFGLVWFGFPAFMKEHPSGEGRSDLSRPPSLG